MENLQTEQTARPKTNVWNTNRTLIKGIIIGVLIFIMLIPVSMISGLISEREQRQNQVAAEVSGKWANAQTLTGPFLIIPYLTPVSTGGAVRKNIVLLPEQLTINGTLLPEVRRRSLYEVMLYRSALSLAGYFDPAYIQKLGIAPENILWNEGQLAFGLNDIKGLEDEVNVQWGSAHTMLEAGMPDNTISKTGLSAPVAVIPQAKTAFNISLKLKGSSGLYFSPIGKTTQVSLTSPWKDPAFDGQYLPSQTARDAGKGFTAQWKILDVSRSYPQVWKDAAEYNVQASAFGVKLLQPADEYAKTYRSVKYAILIISLTFTMFFFIEVLRKHQVHPLQYILIGVALCIFYSLLLSISEYTGFNPAYIIATIATVTLISLYVYGIFKKASIAGGFASAIGGLYLYIFVLIQLEDYALLFGSIGLFVILAIIMYFSRKVDWYNAGVPNPAVPV